MNERIRELLVEAGVINNNFNPLAYEQWYLDSLEKFAELIVRECGVALSPMLRDMVSRGQAYDLIKKHFGVEWWDGDMKLMYGTVQLMGRTIGYRFTPAQV